MTAQTILPANTLSGGYNVDNSVRMSGATVNLQRDFSGDGNRRTWTYSTWFKLSNITQSGFFNWGKGNPEFSLRFESATSDTLNNYFRVSQYDNSQIFDLVTTQFFADPAAWGHMVVAFDTTQGTASNRVKVYFNGTQITSFSTESYPDENFETFVNQASKKHYIGYADYQPINGYLCETVFIDGQQLAPDQFGEFDEDSGIWKPIDVSGLTFGTNGYYLQYKEAGTSQNASGIGADTSGGTNHFAVDDVVATDQSTDTCTNNFATLNSLATGLDATLSEGNLKMVSGTATTRSGTASTIGLTAGKWFAEFKITGSANGIVGIAGTTQNRTATDDDDIGNYPGRTQQGYGYLSGGDVYNNSSAVTGSFASFTTNDIIGVAVDLDGDLLYFYKNGAIQNSGTGIDISGITPHSGNWFFAVGDGSASTASTVECNFGNPITALSSAVADGKGFGSFEFTPKSGHLALCTKNLGSNG
jgi:hypothetical protein|tara:strand:- start:611 stop:2032 length:1422 start_codon:yes stop_codon:yes gene_type:complete